MRARTKLADRILPDYTRGEEIMNMVTHIVGGGLGVAALVLCVVFSCIHKNPWAVVSSAIYGATLILLFTMSSVYHGLTHKTAKKVMQILDHCTIFLLICGTYTPILLVSIRPLYPALAWTIFGIEWGVALIAATFNAIDLKKYKVFSMIAYIAMGWCIIVVLKQTILAVTMPGFLWLLAGGILYTLGAILYGIGKYKHYVHAVFHIFVVLAAVAQFIAVFFYVI